MSLEAVNVIQDIMHDGEKDADRLKAAQDLLNRGGMKQVQEINVNHNTGVSPSDQIMAKINKLKPKDPPAAGDEEIIDALVVDSPEDE